MKRIHLHLAALLLSAAALPAAARQHPADTLRVSDIFTTHIVFNTDLIYADLSNSQACVGKILEQSRNMIALKARSPFATPLSVSALESNGTMHTFIVLFEENPRELVYDIREAVPREPEDAPAARRRAGRRTAGGGGQAGLYRKADAPLLKDVVEAPQALWHISARAYDIEVVCTNIISYSDITYLVFSLRNGSGVSYECADATFVVESGKRSRRSVVYDRNIFPKSRWGTASCAPGDVTRIGYSMDKLSLSKDQVLRVYFYEQGGQREIVLTVDSSDINRARTALR